MKRGGLAVTSAMTALHIASQSRLPEQLSKRMLFSLIFDQLPLKFKCNFLLEG
jgi:hypothetical protein